MKAGFAVRADAEASSNGCDQDARAVISTRALIPSVGSEGGRLQGGNFKKAYFRLIIERKTFKRWNWLPFE